MEGDAQFARAWWYGLAATRPIVQRVPILVAVLFHKDGFCPWLWNPKALLILFQVSHSPCLFQKQTRSRHQPMGTGVAPKSISMVVVGKHFTFLLMV